MRTQVKANNLVAIVIAILLIIIGFTLGFINKRMESGQAQQDVSETSAILGAQLPSTSTQASGKQIIG